MSNDEKNIGPDRIDFVIIGAMKSGTTSMHRYLSGHPDIFMSDIKEPGLFLNRDSHVRAIRSNSELLDKMFQGYDGERVVGESSTHYTKRPNIGSEAPENIKKARPNMKIVYIIRNPLERILSQYLHNLRRKYLSKLDFNPKAKEILGQYLSNVGAAVEHNLNSEEMLNNRHYLRVSLYHYQLSNYFKYFDREQIKVIIFEDFIRHPDKTLSGMYEFLGVTGRRSKREFKKHNKSPFKDVWFSEKVYDEFIGPITEDMDKMRGCIARSLDLWDLSRETWCK